jgi:hypothetical protein
MPRYTCLVESTSVTSGAPHKKKRKKQAVPRTKKIWGHEMQSRNMDDYGASKEKQRLKPAIAQSKILAPLSP